MRKFLIAAVCCIALTGCSSTLTMQRMDSWTESSRGVYQAYFFATGDNERGRTAFILDASSGYKVVPSGRSIIEGTASYSDAYRFMLDKASARPIVSDTVLVNGRPVGILLQYGPTAYDPPMVTVDLYEREGKIYFNAADSNLDN